MKRDYLKHLGFTQTAITMSNKKMTRTEFYKGIMNLENYAPKKAPSQLPAEWLEEIKTCAIRYAQGLKFPTDWAESRIDGAFEDAKIDFHAGATAYAVKLQEAQQEIERLKQWKSEASTLLDPILKYGQSKEANIPLGESITDTVLERCKRYDQSQQEIEKLKLKIARNHNLSTEWLKATTERDDAKQLLEQVIASNIKTGVVSNGIINEIKTFLDGK